jgi:hypothetical protein
MTAYGEMMLPKSDVLSPAELDGWLTREFDAGAVVAIFEPLRDRLQALVDEQRKAGLEQ